MSESDCEISIEVATNYIDEQSEPEIGRYVFAYTITIANLGSTPARLLSRPTRHDEHADERRVREFLPLDAHRGICVGAACGACDPCLVVAGTRCPGMVLDRQRAAAQGRPDFSRRELEDEGEPVIDPDLESTPHETIRLAKNWIPQKPLADLFEPTLRT